MACPYVLLYRAMACPYFYPTARLDQGSWVVPPRLPLGDAHAGECRVPTGESCSNEARPDELHVREVCNSGYGGGRCGRFPQNAPADAVRFHIVKDKKTLIRIQYVLEKDCWPVQHGVAEFVSATREIRGVDNVVLRAQAAAFVESYLRRKNQMLANTA